MINPKVVVQRLLQFILVCAITVSVLIIAQPAIPFIKSFLVFLLEDLSSNQFIVIVTIFMAVVLSEFFKKAIMPLNIWITFWLIVMFIGIIAFLKGFKTKPQITN